MQVFISLITLLHYLPHHKYWDNDISLLSKFTKTFPASPFVVLNILLGSVLLLIFKKLSPFRMTIWSVQFSDTLMHAGLKLQFELC